MPEPLGTCDKRLPQVHHQFLHERISDPGWECINFKPEHEFSGFDDVPDPSQKPPHGWLRNAVDNIADGIARRIKCGGIETHPGLKRSREE